MTDENRIVREVLYELQGRAGFDDWWFDIDDETRREIKAELRGVVRGILKAETDTPALKELWFMTATGKKFYPFNLNPDMIDILDIAYGLGQQSRFNGQTRLFYSIAQHSIGVASILPPEYQLYGLLHDASEAYTGDMVRPFKRGLPDFRRVEDTLQRMIQLKFNLDPEIPEAVKAADETLVETEARDLLANYAEWPRHAEPLPWHLGRPWRPDRAVDEFMQVFHAIDSGWTIEHHAVGGWFVSEDGS